MLKQSPSAQITMSLQPQDHLNNLPQLGQPKKGIDPMERVTNAAWVRAFRGVCISGERQWDYLGFRTSMSIKYNSSCRRWEGSLEGVSGIILTGLSQCQGSLVFCFSSIFFCVLNHKYWEFIFPGSCPRAGRYGDNKAWALSSRCAEHSNVSRIASVRKNAM